MIPWLVLMTVAGAAGLVEVGLLIALWRVHRLLRAARRLPPVDPRPDAKVLRLRL